MKFIYFFDLLNKSVHFDRAFSFRLAVACLGRDVSLLVVLTSLLPWQDLAPLPLAIWLVAYAGVWPKICEPLYGLCPCSQANVSPLLGWDKSIAILQ